jgi:hypothetical protein
MISGTPSIDIPIPIPIYSTIYVIMSVKNMGNAMNIEIFLL